jgi:hypothetical protein
MEMPEGVVLPGDGRLAKMKVTSMATEVAATMRRTNDGVFQCPSGLTFSEMEFADDQFLGVEVHLPGISILKGICDHITMKDRTSVCMMVVRNVRQASKGVLTT